MAHIDLIITQEGLAEIVNAENNGTAPILLTEVGLGTGQYTASKDQTALRGEFKRVSTISGGATADNILHVTITDESEEEYSLYELGIYTESGTLFAVYSQTEPIYNKAALSIAVLAIDIVLTNLNPESVTVGDTNFQLNSATTERQGIIELATQNEVEKGTDNERAVTPATLKAMLDGVVHKAGTEEITGKKTFKNTVVINSASPRLIIQQMDVTQGVMPATAQSNAISFWDCNGATLGYIVNETLTDGVNRLRFAAYESAESSTSHADLSIVYTPKGEKYATAPTPAAGDKSTKVATTEWVTALCGNYLPLIGGTLTGDLTIEKEKPLLIMRNMAHTIGVMPAEDVATMIPFRDRTDIMSGSVGHIHNTENVRKTYLRVYNPVKGTYPEIHIAVDENGNHFTYSPTPKATDKSTQIATTEWVRMYVVPAGSFMWRFTSTVPTGWLACNGAAVSRKTYADLFAAIGTTYGEGDGSTTFNLPDLMSDARFIRAVTSSGTVGTLQDDMLEAHTHEIAYLRGAYTGETSTGWARGWQTYTEKKTTTETGGEETRPVNISLMPLIKY